jgi:Predicted membrane protein
MTRSIRTTALYSASLAGLLLLSACGKNEPATPASTPPAASSAAKTPAPAPATSAPAASGTAAPAPSSTTPAHGSTSASVTPAAAPTETPLTVAKVTLGNDVNAQHEVTRASSSFAPDNKMIYASVMTEGRSGGATLNAKWSYLEGQGQLVSNISQSIATDGPAVTTFKVQNPDLWPEGKYRVEISLDGKPVTKQDFDIKKS